MKKYNIVQFNASTLAFDIIASGDTREEAMAELKKNPLAEGAIYHEVKLLGDPLTVKARTSMVLSRLATEDEPPATGGEQSQGQGKTDDQANDPAE